MKIFSAFLIIVVAAILFMLPLTGLIYNFRTDLRTDAFVYATGGAETTANVTLLKPVYDDDTQTIDILSSLGTDVPVFSSYNTTTRIVDMSGMTANTSRTISVSYDIDALEGSDSINTITDRTPFIWLLIIIAFPMVALFAIFTNRA